MKYGFAQIPRKQQGSRPRQRGSSLVLTLLIMMTLSMTGLVFLSLGETEVKRALRGVDQNQPLFVGEAVLEIVRHWFDDPNPESNSLLPPLEVVELHHRRGDLDWDGLDDDACDGSLGNTYLGGPVAGGRRHFEKPYRDDPRQTFWGRWESPDILIQDGTPGGYLDTLGRLFNSGGEKSIDGLKIAEIRIFRPPVEPELRQRQGMATIEVLVEKYRRGNRTGAKRVRAVLAEIPYPRTQGPLEAGGELAFSGSAEAHWGAVTAEAALRFPQQGGGPRVRSSIPREGFQLPYYEDFSPGARDLTWDGENPNAAGVQNLLTELLGLSVEGLRPRGRAPGPVELDDPWLRFGSAGPIRDRRQDYDDGQPWPYEWNPGSMPNLQRSEDRSHLFANQAVAATPISYDIWKAVATAGIRGAHYFEYVGVDPDGEPLFRENGRGEPAVALEWLDSHREGSGPGLYFFDSANGRDPQGGEGELTPPIRLKTSLLADNESFLQRGFLYFNSTEVQLEGGGGRTVRVAANMPGEPFLDVGIDLDGNGFAGNTPEERMLANNNRWDCDCDGDGDVDADDAQIAFHSHEALGTGGYPDDYKAPTRQYPGTSHQAHEPFLNLDYPTDRYARAKLRVDFQAKGAPLGPEGEEEAGTEPKSTVGHDALGASVDLDVHQDGLLYNEGDLRGRGNFRARGALVTAGSMDLGGDFEIWFDPALRSGTWPLATPGVPRVMPTSLSVQSR